MRPLPGCFLFVLCLGRPCSATCRCVGKFRTIVAAVAGFCLCCCVWVWGDGAAQLVGAWVNSAQSLWPLLAFVCIVLFGLGRWCSATCGCVGKFCTIVAAIASFCLCCVWGDGAWCSATLGRVGKFRTIVAAV